MAKWNCECEAITQIIRACSQLKMHCHTYQKLRTKAHHKRNDRLRYSSITGLPSAPSIYQASIFHQIFSRSRLSPLPSPSSVIMYRKFCVEFPAVVKKPRVPLSSAYSHFRANTQYIRLRLVIECRRPSKSTTLHSRVPRWISLC